MMHTDFLKPILMCISFCFFTLTVFVSIHSYKKMEVLRYMVEIGMDPMVAYCAVHADSTTICTVVATKQN